MGTVQIAQANEAVILLSVRAVMGSVIVLLLLIVVTNALRKNPHTKRIAFFFVVLLILITSTLLWTTAYMHIHNVNDDTYVTTGAAL